MPIRPAPWSEKWMPDSWPKYSPLTKPSATAAIFVFPRVGDWVVCSEFSDHVDGIRHGFLDFGINLVGSCDDLHSFLECRRVLHDRIGLIALNKSCLASSNLKRGRNISNHSREESHQARYSYNLAARSATSGWSTLGWPWNLISSKLPIMNLHHTFPRVLIFLHIFSHSVGVMCL